MDAMYDLVMEGRLSEANRLVQDAKKKFPLIDLVEIDRGSPPKEDFLIALDGELLRIEYPIRDDGETRTAPNIVAVAVIQAQRLLEIVSPHEFRVDIVHGRRTSYGIPVSTRFPLFNPWNISFMALLTGLVVWLILQHYFPEKRLLLRYPGP